MSKRVCVSSQINNVKKATGKEHPTTTSKDFKVSVSVRKKKKKTSRGVYFGTDTWNIAHTALMWHAIIIRR